MVMPPAPKAPPILAHDAPRRKPISSAAIITLSGGGLG